MNASPANNTGSAAATSPAVANQQAAAPSPQAATELQQASTPDSPSQPPAGAVDGEEAQPASGNSPSQVEEPADRIAAATKLQAIGRGRKEQVKFQKAKAGITLAQAQARRYLQHQRQLRDEAAGDGQNLVAEAAAVPLPEDDLANELARLNSMSTADLNRLEQALVDRRVPRTVRRTVDGDAIDAAHALAGRTRAAYDLAGEFELGDDVVTNPGEARAMLQAIKNGADDDRVDRAILRFQQQSLDAARLADAKSSQEFWQGLALGGFGVLAIVVPSYFLCRRRNKKVKTAEEPKSGASTKSGKTDRDVADSDSDSDDDASPTERDALKSGLTAASGVTGPELI